MPIIYALIARQQNVLCEFTEGTGNFMTIARAVLRDVDEGNHTTETRNVFTIEGHNFFFFIFDELIYLCMCDDFIRANVAFAMLDETKTEFLAKYGQRGKTAIAYAMKDFDVHLKALMEKYEHVKIDSPLTQVIFIVWCSLNIFTWLTLVFWQVHERVDKLKNLMIENMNQVRPWYIFFSSLLLLTFINCIS